MARPAAFHWPAADSEGLPGRVCQCRLGDGGAGGVSLSLKPGLEGPWGRAASRKLRAAAVPVHGLRVGRRGGGPAATGSMPHGIPSPASPRPGRAQPLASALPVKGRRLGCEMRFAKRATTNLKLVRAYEEDNFAPLIMRSHTRYSAAESPLSVTALPQPPKSSVLQVHAIVPAQLADLLPYSVHRIVCCQQGSIPLYPATHSRVAGVQVALHMEAVLWPCCSLWHCCSLRRGPAQVRKVPYGKACKE